MQAPKEISRLVVTLHEDGSVNVNGDLAEKLRCYGMLECAKDAIRTWNEMQERELMRTRAKPMNMTIQP